MMQHGTAQRGTAHLTRYLRIVPRCRMPITASACEGRGGGWAPPSRRCSHPLLPPKLAAGPGPESHPRCPPGRLLLRRLLSYLRHPHLLPPLTNPHQQPLPPHTCAYSSPDSKSSTTSWLTYLASTHTGCGMKKGEGGGGSEQGSHVLGFPRPRRPARLEPHSPNPAPAAAPPPRPRT